MESIRPAALRRMYERAERKLWDPALPQSDRIDLLQAIVVLKTAEHIALYEIARAELPPR